MPAVKEKKVRTLITRYEPNLNQTNYNTKYLKEYNPEEDISEPNPEEAPEDFSKSTITTEDFRKYFPEAFRILMEEINPPREVLC